MKVILTIGNDEEFGCCLVSAVTEEHYKQGYLASMTINNFKYSTFRYQ